jgi:hypothetical protein
VPATAGAGTETARVGFHEAELTALPLARLKAVCGTVRLTLAAALAWPGVNVPVPVVAMAGPDQ